MKRVAMIRFPGGSYTELFGRKVTVLREQDGFRMQLCTSTGLLYIWDPKDKVEAVIHTSKAEAAYLAPEEPEKPADKGKPQVK